MGAVSFGTTCFSHSRGLVARVASTFGLAVYQICRGGTVCGAPFNTPSQVLSGAMRELRRERGDCLIVAYSDRNFNEVGTIYQACNGLYTGQTKPKNQSNYVIDGRTVSAWLVRRRYGTRAMEKLRKIDPRIIKAPLTPKYRYVFVQASRRTKAKVLSAFRPHILPYPNRISENIGPMRIADLVDRRSMTRSTPKDGVIRAFAPETAVNCPAVVISRDHTGNRAGHGED